MDGGDSAADEEGSEGSVPIITAPRGGGAAREKTYSTSAGGQRKRFLPPPRPPRPPCSFALRKWFKSIGFLYPPVISHKMSAWMRMGFVFLP